MMWLQNGHVLQRPIHGVDDDHDDDDDDDTDDKDKSKVGEPGPSKMQQQHSWFPDLIVLQNA